MCGIAGIIAINPGLADPVILEKMTGSLAHRGPDGYGHWISEDKRVALGHRRLSILDLSDSAGQPMHLQDRYTLVFNGEIYNYLELRDELIRRGHVFKTQSDTEVLLALYASKGEQCLHELDGMFAFAVYDAVEHTLFCARDRFGEKPFFFHHRPGQSFLFASEMKALWAAGVEKSANQAMLFRYLQDGFLDNPDNHGETFFNGCQRLPHGQWLKLDCNTLLFRTGTYYRLNWEHTDHTITAGQAVERFRGLLYTSVRRRLRSDVPVGSSLSGGLDSSLIVCIINELIGGTGQVQKTFSAVFPGFERDESRYIRKVVEATNAEAHYVTPDEKELEKEIGQLLFYQEEPVGSASIFVQYRVMQLAKEQGVTVLLDGQGADEVLAGYHFFYKRFFSELYRTDQSLYRKELSAYRTLHAGNTVNQKVHGAIAGKLALAAGPLLPVAQRWKKRWDEWRAPFFNDDFYNSHRNEGFSGLPREQTLNEALYNATCRRGLQELLRYADRNSMAHGREVRVPFLSHELVDFLFTLPAVFKIHDGWTKWLLRESFSNLLPSEIAWRKDKIGYEPPQKKWLGSKVMQEMMREATVKLVNDRILHRGLANKMPDAPDASSSAKNSWRILMAANLIG
jgi:asparagine synthase (glutamine-hydrolysing)